MSRWWSEPRRVRNNVVVKSNRAVALVVVVVVAILVGFAVTQSPASKPFPVAAAPRHATRSTHADPNGYDAVDLADPPFHFAVPHTWRNFDLTKKSLDAITRNLEAANPKLAEELSGKVRAAIASHARFFAVDAVTSENVSVQAIPGALTSDLTGEIEQELRQIPGIEGISVHTLTIDNRDAERADYSLTLTNTSGVTTSVRGVQIYAPSAENVIIVTITLNAAHNAISDNIVGSMKIPTSA